MATKKVLFQGSYYSVDSYTKFITKDYDGLIHGHHNLPTAKKSDSAIWYESVGMELIGNINFLEII